jgi:hypothetical protein
VRQLLLLFLRYACVRLWHVSAPQPASAVSVACFRFDGNCTTLPMIRGCSLSLYAREVGRIRCPGTGLSGRSLVANFEYRIFRRRLGSKALRLVRHSEFLIFRDPSPHGLTNDLVSSNAESGETRCYFFTRSRRADKLLCRSLLGDCCFESLHLGLHRGNPESILRIISAYFALTVTANDKLRNQKLRLRHAKRGELVKKGAFRSDRHH